MSIIELTIVGAISVILVFALIEVSTMVHKTTVSTENKIDKSGLFAEVRGILFNEILCTSTLKDQPYANGSEIKLNDLYLKKDGKYGRLTLNSVRLEDYLNIAQNRGKSNLIIEGVKSAEPGNSEFRLEISITYNTKAGGLIDSCAKEVIVQTEANCLALGGEWDGTSCNFCANMGGKMEGGKCVFPESSSYSWSIGRWQDSSLCVSGVQSRLIECIDNRTGLTVDNSNCPPPAPKATQPCTDYDWYVTAWSTCGTDGKQWRSVSCVAMSDPLKTPVPESNCPNSKPLSSQPCLIYDWVVSPWGACQPDGLRQRSVVCQHTPTATPAPESNCLANSLKPPSKEACIYYHPCGEKCVLAPDHNIYRRGATGTLYNGRVNCMSNVPDTEKQICAACVFDDRLKFEILDNEGPLSATNYCE